MPIFRASELDRLFACPGSAFLLRGEDREGIAAAWGTKVHSWMETGVLPEGKDGFDLDKRIRATKTTRESLWPDCEHEVAYALNLVTDKVVRYVPPNPLPPGYSAKAHKSAWKDAFDDEWATGTLDAQGEIMGQWWVDDLKTGRNAHWTDYEAQQLFYCLVVSLYSTRGSIAGGRSTITHWPRYPIARVPNRLGVSVEPDYLASYRNKLKRLREEIITARTLFSTGQIKENQLCVGSHCRFCPSRLSCPALGSPSTPPLLSLP